ncbi:MAG: hypothetical protein QJR03_11135 [Sphaerobacter sp.]|nr:hypothetical protein [Sphaerobacter sp.]
MAELRTSTAQHADALLDRLIEAWSELPQIVAELDTWDPVDRADYIEGWPRETVRLHRLERYMSEGTPTAEQRARYRELRALIAKNRPLLERVTNR